MAGNASAVQAAMESIAQGSEPKEELVFNPVTGELEAVTPAVAKASTTKPVMTRIAKDGFFSVIVGSIVERPCTCGSCPTLGHPSC